MKTLDEIKKLMAAGDTAQANEALRELLAAEPDNLQAKMLYGICRQLCGDEKTFRRIYDELAPMMEPLKDAPSDAETLFPCETITLWQKYHKLWMALIIGGLVLAGMGIGLCLGVESTDVAPAVSSGLYGGPQRPEVKYRSGQKEVVEEAVNTNKEFLYGGPRYERKSVSTEQTLRIRETSDVEATRVESPVETLVRGVKEGNKDLASETLAKGADPNGSIDRNITPLGAAVDGLVIPDIDILRLLLAAGADPNRKWGNCGTTPFYSLVQSSCWGKKSPKELSSYSEAIRLMIRHGADPNRKQGAFGHSPLSYAVMRGADLSLIKILVEEGHGVVMDKMIEGAKNEAVKEYLQRHKNGESK